VYRCLLGSIRWIDTVRGEGRTWWVLARDGGETRIFVWDRFWILAPLSVSWSLRYLAGAGGKSGKLVLLYSKSEYLSIDLPSLSDLYASSNEELTGGGSACHDPMIEEQM